MRDYSVYLEQILEMVEKLRGSNLGKLETDDDLFDATIMRLQVLGESASKVSLKIQKRFSNVPWAMLIKTRDFVSHHYERVDINILRNLVVEKILPLEKDLIKVLREIEKMGGDL